MDAQDLRSALGCEERTATFELTDLDHTRIFARLGHNEGVPSETVDKKALSERDICTKFITPAIERAGWDLQNQLREEVYITKGRIIVRGRMTKRAAGKRVDYILYYKPNIPIALIEAKDNNHAVGDGMQQALEYGDARRRARQCAVKRGASPRAVAPSKSANRRDGSTSFAASVNRGMPDASARGRSSIGAKENGVRAAAGAAQEVQRAAMLLAGPKQAPVPTPKPPHAPSGHHPGVPVIEAPLGIYPPERAPGSHVWRLTAGVPPWWARTVRAARPARLASARAMPSMPPA